jgi:hypothetical protein
MACVASIYTGVYTLTQRSWFDRLAGALDRVGGFGRDDESRAGLNRKARMGLGWANPLIRHGDRGSPRSWQWEIPAIGKPARDDAQYENLQAQATGGALPRRRPETIPTPTLERPLGSRRNSQAYSTPAMSERPVDSPRWPVCASIHPLAEKERSVISGRVNMA